MKRILASLLILLWPLVFASKASATTGGNPDSRLKPLTLKTGGWVSDTDYLLNQSSEDDRDMETSEQAQQGGPQHPAPVQAHTSKESKHAKAHVRQPSRAANSARPTR
jgi:hypothetical protein